MKIRIIFPIGVIEGELNDSETAKELFSSLPISARANTWGKEVYFGIPVYKDEEDAVERVNVGDIGYWPPGHAMCLFFGPTPISKGNEIRPASPVNLVGKLIGDLSLLNRVTDGMEIHIEKA
ncbi:MAG: cyclophilin-like fold protein [bacterium]